MQAQVHIKERVVGLAAPYDQGPSGSWRQLSPFAATECQPHREPFLARLISPSRWNLHHRKSATAMLQSTAQARVCHGHQVPVSATLPLVQVLHERQGARLTALRGTMVPAAGTSCQAVRVSRDGAPGASGWRCAPLDGWSGSTSLPISARGRPVRTVVYIHRY